jgi:hypothetical protein
LAVLQAELIGRLNISRSNYVYINRMNNSLRRPLIAAFLVFSFGISASAQTAKSSVVLERQVRAGMEFLAGDAMQGRGSGTAFERIAAEYVGSQFMQFGLEPAGDNGWSGDPSFVQTITIARRTFAGSPTVKFGDTTLTHGGEMLVWRTNIGAASGPLNHGVPDAGSAYLMRPRDGEDQRALIQRAGNLSAAGVAIVLIEETPQWRGNWAAMGSRLPAFTATNAKPGVIAVVSKAAADEIANAADGTAVEFGGQLAPPNDQFTWNAIGKITGTDAKLNAEVVVLSSHLDHLGVRENTPGDDKIFNGADDDASGTIAVIELARVLAAGPKPKRTVYFVAYGSEEAGGFGSRHFVDNLPFAKDKLVANLQFEMIGRPDAKVKADELWLTGYERSNLGPELAKRGAKLVADPHPDQNFFQRSDNYTLARQGIVAHTVSSFGLHTDYHKVTDELRTIDFQHMTRSINSIVAPINWLVNSDFRPVWNEGMKP